MKYSSDTDIISVIYTLCLFSAILFSFRRLIFAKVYLGNCGRKIREEKKKQNNQSVAFFLVILSDDSSYSSFYFIIWFHFLLFIVRIKQKASSERSTFRFHRVVLLDLSILFLQMTETSNRSYAGIDAIVHSCSKVYPDQLNPTQATSVIKYW